VNRLRFDPDYLKPMEDKAETARISEGAKTSLSLKATSMQER